MLKVFIKFIIIYLMFINFLFSSNSFADDLTNIKMHQLRDQGYSIHSVELEDGYWHAILVKKPTFKVDKNGRIAKVETSRVVICKFNMEKTVCKYP